MMAPTSNRHRHSRRCSGSADGSLAPGPNTATGHREAERRQEGQDLNRCRCRAHGFPQMHGASGVASQARSRLHGTDTSATGISCVSKKNTTWM